MAKRPLRLFPNNGNPYIIIRKRRVYLKNYSKAMMELIKKKASQKKNKRFPLISKDKLKDKFVTKVAKKIPRSGRQPRESNSNKKIIDDLRVQIAKLEREKQTATTKNEQSELDKKQKEVEAKIKEFEEKVKAQQKAIEGPKQGQIEWKDPNEFVREFLESKGEKAISNELIEKTKEQLKNNEALYDEYKHFIRERDELKKNYKKAFERFQNVGIIPKDIHYKSSKASNPVDDRGWAHALRYIQKKEGKQPKSYVRKEGDLKVDNMDFVEKYFGKLKKAERELKDKKQLREEDEQKRGIKEEEKQEKEPEEEVKEDKDKKEQPPRQYDPNISKQHVKAIIDAHKKVLQRGEELKEKYTKEENELAELKRKREESERQLREQHPEEGSSEEGEGRMPYREEGLTGEQVYDLCDELPGFIGVFTDSTLSSIKLEIDGPIASFIYLYEKYSGDINHWVAIFIDFYEEEIDWYDAFGEKPMPEKLKRFFHNLLQDYGVSRRFALKENKVQNQGDSANCGIYASWYIHMRTFGFSNKDATGFTDIPENEQRMARARINWQFI